MAVVEPKLHNLSLYDVARALEEGRVAMNLQPIICARDTRFSMFHEGLIRIIDLDGHVRVAGEFMDLVEGNEIGRMVDQSVLALALRRLQMDPSVRISINLSMRSLWDEEWMAMIDDAARLDQSLTERLVVEFTESSVLEDPDRLLEFMKYCRKYDVVFAVDDFGAGHTVLGHLRDFRFDILKIDGSICHDLGENLDNQVIVKSILSVAKHFEMMTVAEFIDNEAAAEKCKEFGVDGLQGFLFGKGELFNPDNPDILPISRRA